jgi:gliding motility-associated-like protein
MRPVACSVQEVNILPPQFSISVISLGNPCEVSTIGSAQVIASGGTEPYTYLWDNDETTAIAENLTEGTHSVTVTDASGCEAIGEVEIILLPNGFMVEIMADQDTLCAGESVQLTAISEGAEAFTWNTGASGSTVTFSPETTAYYEVTAKRLGDNIIENGDFSAGNTNFVSDYSDAIGLGLGGTWGPLSLEGTYAVTNDPSSVHTNFIACGDHTSGTGNMLVVNGSGVPDLPAWCQTVTVNPDLTYQFSAWLTSVVSDNPAVLQFSINGELLGEPFQAGFTTCEWTNFFEIWEAEGATTAEICIVNQNISVGGNDFALDDIALVPVCLATAGITIQVSDLEAFTTNVEPVSCETNFGSAVALSINGEAPYTYAWSNGATTAEVDNFEAGTYTVTITDAFGCTAEASAVIEPGPFVVIDEVVVTDVTCGPVQADNIVIIPGSAEVFPGAGDEPFTFSLDGGTTFQDSPIFENLDPGLYIATIQDANSCQAHMDFEVGDVDLPSVSIQTQDEFNLCNGGSIDLWVETTAEVDSVIWSINSMADTITLVESGLVGVRIVDEEGCSAFFEVEIDDCIDYRIPNVFTPNGDDYNDVFKVYTSGGVAVKRMQLFNRWGNLVHDSTAPWNGVYKGEPHQSDVLIYIIVIDTGEGEVVEQGEVTLLR